MREECPSIAVIVPCWNGEKWIGRAIQSVIDQNYPDLEIIVIDDGSTDRSLEIIKSFGGQVRWKSGPNRGACAARNAGFELSHSRYVLFLDADDYLQGDFLLGLSKAVTAKRQDVVFGPHVVESEDGRCAEFRYDEAATKRDLVSSIVNFEGPTTAAALWRRGFLSELGCWDTRLGRLQDYFLSLHGVTQCSSFAISRRGASVYWDHDSDNRVSRQRTAKTELSVLYAYREYLRDFEQLLTEKAKGFLAEQLYFLALDLYRRSYVDDANAGFALCRSLGLRGHVGNFRHRILCATLGLKNKERLSFAKKCLATYLKRKFGSFTQRA